MKITNTFDYLVTNNGDVLRAAIRQYQKVEYVVSEEKDTATLHNLSREDLIELRNKIDQIIFIMDDACKEA